MNVCDSSARLLAATALVLGLAACTGYTAVDLGGTVSGLTTDGLVLANGGATVAIPANATTYKFPTQIDDNGPYSVTIQAQPVHLTCTLANASGNTSGLAISNVNVSCVRNSYSVGGTVTGLTSEGLVLNNGSDTVTVPANSTAFTFPTKVSDGSVYGVAVLTQPSQPVAQNCVVANGTNFMGAADVTNITVTCM